MIRSYEESNQGCLRYLVWEVVLLIVVALLMSVPCVLCGMWIISSGD
jgi:hypothetical protein